MRTWKNVATIVKTKGLSGRFVAHAAAGLPFLLEEGMSVAFVPPQTDMPRNGVVNYVRDIDGESFEVGFDSVADGETAHALAGCSCLVKRDLLDEDELAEHPETWVDWEVRDASGEFIGTAVGVIDNPGQSLLEVSRSTGKPAYIPLVDEFIVEADAKRSLVVVDLPAGLLDL